MTAPVPTLTPEATLSGPLSALSGVKVEKEEAR
jgi:hypothetical protein